MSGTTALALSILIFLSIWASYACGQRNMFIRMRDQQERRKRLAEWEDFDQ